MNEVGFEFLNSTLKARFPHFQGRSWINGSRWKQPNKSCMLIFNESYHHKQATKSDEEIIYFPKREGCINKRSKRKDKPKNESGGVEDADQWAKNLFLVHSL